MSIDARIASIMQRKGDLWLRLAAYQTSNGTMSIPGTNTLVIKAATRWPHPGQKIWGNAGACVIEAGNGGERMEYTRAGSILTEKEESV